MSTSSTASPALPKFDNTLGSLYLAPCVSMALWGAGSVQTYYYYDIYRKDAWWLKLFVAVVWTLDTVHQALTMKVGYVYLVSNFNNLDHIGIVDPAILQSLAITSFVCLFVQSFFVVRIYKLSNGNYILAGITGVLVFGQFLLTIIDYGKIANYKTFLQLSTDFRVVRAVNALSVAADATIALTLVFLLHKIRSGFKRSDTLINKLIAYAINTSLVTGICSVGSLVATVAWPQTFIFLFFYFSFSRMYTNTLFAALNSRDVSKSDVSISQSSGVEVSSHALRSLGTNRPIHNFDAPKSFFAALPRERRNSDVESVIDVSQKQATAI